MTETKTELVKRLLDRKAEENNQIDLNAYALGLEAMYEAINYTRCCKSDSEQLLFSADEIVSKINEQTVLDGETFRVYFREK